MTEYVYVAVDETGNLGRSLKGERYYTLVACVVSDRKRFEDATRRLGYREEVKFNTHDFLREKVLEYAVPAISDVFYVRYPKKKGVSLNRFEQSELHLKMVRSLADSIVLRYGYSNDLVVEIDHKDGILDRAASELFSANEYKARRIFCEVMDSSESYGLQTNDFIVGAIGQMLSRSDHRYVRMLENEPRPSYVRSENRKPGRDLLPSYGGVQAHTDIPPKTGKPPEIPMKAESERKRRRQSFPMVPYKSYGSGTDIMVSGRKRGEPASVPRSTGHKDSPSKTGSPPRIAMQLRTLRAGYRMVRLSNKDGRDGHKKVSSKEQNGGHGMKSTKKSRMTGIFSRLGRGRRCWERQRTEEAVRKGR